MDKKRLKAALVVLDAAKSRFPETTEFIDDTLKGECKKELQMRQFFKSLEVKNQSRKTILF